MKRLEPFVTFDEAKSNEDKGKLERAKAVDLITLPKKVEGVNCGNCEYYRDKTKYCQNEKVMQHVTTHMCCSLWDAPGAERAWVKKEEEEAKKKKEEKEKKKAKEPAKDEVKKEKKDEAEQPFSIDETE